ncbi:hypothetical protein HDU76_006206 [Blyttiomyces sp. JEL0837]|nr:hypothetical protein HDU76_006206 [Blyttiomyces sp. JEL0837]
MSWEDLPVAVNVNVNKVAGVGLPVNVNPPGPPVAAVVGARRAPPSQALAPVETPMVIDEEPESALVQVPGAAEQEIDRPSTTTLLDASPTESELAAEEKASKPIPWPNILRKLYPGQVSHLRPNQREAINEAVKEFLLEAVGPDHLTECQYLMVRATGSKMYYAIPPPLQEQFSIWIGQRLDDIVLSDDFSGKVTRRRRKSVSRGDSPPMPMNGGLGAGSLMAGGVGGIGGSAASFVAGPPMSAVVGRSPVLPSGFKAPSPLPPTRALVPTADARFQPQPQQRSSPKPSATGPAVLRPIGTSSLSPDAKIDNSIRNDTLVYVAPLEEYFPDGRPNRERYRAWTEVIRAKYPKFHRAHPLMSLTARAFLKKHNLPDVLLSSSASKSAKRTLSIPEKYHEEFLKIMEAKFGSSEFAQETPTGSAVGTPIAGDVGYDGRESVESDLGSTIGRNEPRNEHLMLAGGGSGMSPVPVFESFGRTRRSMSLVDEQAGVQAQNQAQAIPMSAPQAPRNQSPVQVQPQSQQQQQQQPQAPAPAPTTAPLSVNVNARPATQYVEIRPRSPIKGPETDVTTTGLRFGGPGPFQGHGTGSLMAWMDVAGSRYEAYLQSIQKNSFLLGRMRAGIRSFIQERVVAFGWDPLECTAQREGGKGRKCLAIPSPLHKVFLEWFEYNKQNGFKAFPYPSVQSPDEQLSPDRDELFGGLGVGAGAGDAGAAGAVAGMAGGNAVAMEGPATAALYDNGVRAKRKAEEMVGGTGAGFQVSKVSKTDEAARPVSPERRTNVPAESTGGNAGAQAGNNGGLTTAAGGDDGDDEEGPGSGKAGVKAQFSKTIISASGMKLTRYNIIVSQLMKDFKRLPREARLAVKKAVKQFLIIKLDERAKECVLRCEGTSYVTYGVPDELLGTFKHWLHGELSRVFPDFTIERLEDAEDGGAAQGLGQEESLNSAAPSAITDGGNGDVAAPVPTNGSEAGGDVVKSDVVMAEVGSVAEAPVGGDKMEGVVEGSAEVSGANVEEVNAATAGAVAASSGEVVEV